MKNNDKTNKNPWKIIKSIKFDSKTMKKYKNHDKTNKNQWENHEIHENPLQNQKNPTKPIKTN